MRERAAVRGGPEREEERKGVAREWRVFADMVWAFFDSLGGHYSIQTALEVKSDLRFQISDLKYLHIHLHIAYIYIYMM